MFQQHNDIMLNLHEYVKKLNTIPCQQPTLTRIQNIFYYVKLKIR